VQVTVAKSSPFYLHSSLLTLESETFSKTLKGGFKEAKEQAITHISSFNPRGDVDNSRNMATPIQNRDAHRKLGTEAWYHVVRASAVLKTTDSKM
jgi:hypothetical protein